MLSRLKSGKEDVESAENEILCLTLHKEGRVNGADNDNLILRVMVRDPLGSKSKIRPRLKVSVNQWRNNGSPFQGPPGICTLGPHGACAAHAMVETSSSVAGSAAERAPFGGLEANFSNTKY